MTALAAFTPEEKRLRRDALAMLERCEDAWERWHSRPFASYPRDVEARHEERLNGDERLAVFVLDQTSRGAPQDAALAAHARQGVRTACMLAKASDARGDTDGAAFYRTRVRKTLTFYRRAVAAAHAPHQQAAE